MTESRLRGKVALVTGASKGIGAEIAVQLAAAGAAVHVNYASDAAGAERVVAAIVASGGTAFATQGDVTDPAGRARVVEQSASAFGRLDILVNNAGVFQHFPLEDITEAAIERMFRVNVFGLILVTQGVVPLMREGASVINVSSLASTSSPLHATIYSATKAAVDSITRSLARELGPRGIRVNAIRPGAVETEGTLAGDLIGGQRRRDFIAAAPLGRIGQPADIAPMAVFLASEESAWMTGETVLVSGGRF